MIYKHIIDISDEPEDFTPKAGNEGRADGDKITITLAPLTYAQDSKAMRIASGEVDDGDSSRWFDAYLRECLSARIKSIKNLWIRKNGEVKEITSAPELYHGTGVLAQIMAEVSRYISTREAGLKKKTPSDLPSGSMESSQPETHSQEIASS